MSPTVALIGTGWLKWDVSFVPDLITLKIGHCFLLSKYKNTFIWIKMYTVENSSMHSLGVWKRRFSCRVCIVLHWLVWRLQPGLGAWELRFLEHPSNDPFWSLDFAGLGFKMFAASLKPLSAIFPPGTGLAPIMTTFSLSFWIQLGSHPTQPSHRVWKSKRNNNRRDSTTNMVAVPSKLGTLPLKTRVMKTLEGGLLWVEGLSLCSQKVHVLEGRKLDLRQGYGGHAEVNSTF